MSEVALALALGSSKVKMGLATARATVSICGAAAAASPSSIAKPFYPPTHCHFLPTSLFSSCMFSFFLHIFTLPSFHHLFTFISYTTKKIIWI